MMQLIPGNVSDEDSKEEEAKETGKENEQMEVTSLFQGLSLEDFSTDDSSDQGSIQKEEPGQDDDLDRTERIQEWRYNIEETRRYINEGYTPPQKYTGPMKRVPTKRMLQRVLRLPGKQSDGRHSLGERLQFRKSQGMSRIVHGKTPKDGFQQTHTEFSEKQKQHSTGHWKLTSDQRSDN